jgi:predicted neuraminidase
MNNINQEREIDILVVGGGMAGVTAAMAAKTDTNTVTILESSNVLGGQGTAGGVAGFCGDTDRTNDLFRDLVARLGARGLIKEYAPNEDRRAYDLEWCAFYLQEMVAEKGIDILLHTRLLRADAEDFAVTRVEVSTAGGVYVLKPKFVIDATGVCVVPMTAGFPVDHDGANKQLPMSLYFTLWDTGKPVEPFLPDGCVDWADSEEIPMTSLHVFDSGKVEIKMKVVGFDSADGFSFSAAEIQARRHMMSLIYFLQTKGYQGRKLDRHVLASVSRQIGVRETRRLKGEHVLTQEEVSNGTVFPDGVAVGTYHFDYHWPDKMQRAGTGITKMVEPYHIPLRSMTPVGARNILVPGRGASGDQMAMSSFRVMAIVSQMGFAAGKAAQLCVEEGITLEALDIGRLRQRIEAGGQSLDLSDYGGYLRKALCISEHVYESDERFAECHASTLVQVRDGRFLVAWFAGTKEGDGDVGIWIADRYQCAWSKPRLVAKVNDEPHWNPVLHRAPDGSVRLFFKVGPTVPAWKTWTMVSTDEGESWSEPVAIASDAPLTPGPVRDKPILLSDGSLLAGNSVETEEKWDIFVDRSNDGGLAWTHSDLIELDREAHQDRKDEGRERWGAVLWGDEAFAGKGVIQPTLWESSPGVVHLLARSTTGVVCRSDSSDGGKTWCPLYGTILPNNNSGIDVARLPGDVLALVYNPVADNWGARTPLRVSLSMDNGATWPHSLELETEEGEYSYPAIIATAKGMAITYTWKRLCIAFWHLSIEHVMDYDSIRKHEAMLGVGMH